MSVHVCLYVCLYVCASGSKVLVGHKAISQADHNPTNTLYDAKRFIGKRFTNDELNAEAARYPFKVVIVLELTSTVKINCVRASE